MVKLSIHSSKGNSNQRYYPHSGYLGLTPVKVEGVVRTRLDDDGKPLQANSITVSVRCIECRLKRGSVVHSNVLVEYSQSLWTKLPGVEYHEVGNGTYEFKIVIPAKTPGFSCANFLDYRIFWRLEAVIDHMPIYGVGSRLIKSYELPLVRYDANVSRSFPAPSSSWLSTNKPRAPVIRYQFLTPTTAVAPLDIVSIPLVLHPVDPALVIRSASLVVERRIDMYETAALPSSPFPSASNRSPVTKDEDSSGSTVHGIDHGGNAEASSSRVPLIRPPEFNPSVASLSTTYTAESFGSSVEQRPLLPPLMTDLPAKTTSLTVAHVDSTGPFKKETTGEYRKSLTLKWPASKSNSHWAMGETMRTELINVRFFVHVKIIVSSPTTGTESIDLEERELLLVATNESERRLAAQRYMETRASRSKSKSPYRGSRESAENPDLPVPPVPRSAIPSSHYLTRADPSTSSSSPSSAKVRRPHTSAGPRDKASSRSLRTHDHPRERERERHRESDRPGKISPILRLPRRPETAQPTSNLPPPLPILGKSFNTHSHSHYVHPYPLSSRNQRDNSSLSSETSSSSSGGDYLNDPGTVRAWEEELARIELKSRRDSVDMLGFNRRRSRPNTASSSVTSTSGSSS